MSTALYSTVTNALSRKKLIRQLGEVVAGTKAAGYAYILKADADKLLAADTTLVTLDATGTLNAKGEIAVAATTAGVTAYEANKPAETAAVARVVTPAQPFELETNVPLPEYRRGGGGSAYPVDTLEIGQALFVADVAATDTTPAVDAHKVLSSVAATANRKYKGSSPVRFFSVRGKQTKGDKTGARIWRVEPPVASTVAAPAAVAAPATV